MLDRNSLLSGEALWELFLSVARELNLDDFQGPFQLRPFYDSMIP